MSRFSCDARTFRQRCHLVDKRRPVQCLVTSVIYFVFLSLSPQYGWVHQLWLSPSSSCSSHPLCPDGLCLISWRSHVSWTNGWLRSTSATCVGSSDGSTSSTSSWSSPVSGCLPLRNSQDVLLCCPWDCSGQWRPQWSARCYTHG